MRSPIERDMCWCLNIDRRPYKECQRDYEANFTKFDVENEINFADELECEKLRTPKEQVSVGQSER